MSDSNPDSKDAYLPISSTLSTTSSSKDPSKKYLKRIKRNTNYHRTKNIGLIVLLLTTLIIISYALTNLHKQFADFNPSPSVYKRILNQPLEEITETLSPSLLNTPIVLSLIEKADIYPKAKILLANHEAYPYSLLELATNRPETLDFVINYVNYEASALSTESTNSISIFNNLSPGNIPLFIQWDARWGYESYGNEFIASGACGPTALSMVAVGLTGNTDMHPKAISDFSYGLGYFHSGEGTSWALMSEGATRLGLDSEELSLDALSIYNALEEGKPIIVSMGAGHFTESGHFIVLVGTTSDGKIKVNDPGSIENSEIAWDLSLIMNEAKNLWAFSAA